MANTKSIKKVSDYLNEIENPITASEIMLNVGLSKKAVMDILEILHNYREVEVVSNGKTTLVINKKTRYENEKESQSDN